MQKIEDMVVVARNPAEMQVAQRQLVDWAAKKIEEKKAQWMELQENYEIAVKNKWRSSTLQRNAANAKKEMEYYEKVHAALDAGYCIIPNMDIDVFAIRTTRKKPKAGYGSQWANREQKSSRPAIGDGRYVDAAPVELVETKKVQNREGQMVTQHNAWADSFQEVDFPFKMAKPQILDSTAKAMAMRVFDDIGVLPKRTRRGDPMVVGRIVHRKGYTDHTMSFLITWFVDTKDFL